MPDLEMLRIPLPPVDEQRRIINFVGEEVLRLDRVVKLRAEQIDAIDERGVSRTFDGVRGVGEPGGRKRSGLAWLGPIPLQWRVAAVSHLFEVELGKMLNQSRAQGGHLRPYLRVANVQWDVIDVDDLLQMDFPPSEQSRFRLRKGDLLVCEGGSWPGRAAIWNGELEEIYYQKALHRIRPAGEDLARWLYYCLRVAERLKVFLTQGNNNTITHLTREQLRPQRFPFPDVATQRRIVRELDKAAERDLLAKANLSRQIGVLAERRRVLITAAVTGQIDVTTARGTDA